MNQADDFKVMIGSQILFIGQPTAVITGYTEKSKVYSEIFYSILDPKEEIKRDNYRQVLSASFREDKEKPNFIIEEFWKGLVIPHIANQIFYKFIHPILESKPEIYKVFKYINPVSLSDTGKPGLYYIKKKRKDLLDLIRNKTKSKVLQEYIKLFFLSTLSLK